MKCEQCEREFNPTRKIARFCSSQCQKLWHWHHSVKVKNIKPKPKKVIPTFTYENVGGKIIQKPMEEHVYHPNNVTKMDDRSNYYRGSGVFGYDEHVAVGYEDESSIE